MIQTVQVNTIDDFYKIINDQPYIPSMGRYRSLFVYRGMSDVAFPMETSLQRNCGELSGELEERMLFNFRKYALSEDPTADKSIWRQLIMGQHYGLPTRLLDWTRSPLIAAHFATAEKDLDKMAAHDCVIWRLDMREMDSLLPEHYQEECKKRGVDVYTFSMLEEADCVTLEQYDHDMGDSAMVIAEPPSIDPRIVNQYSFFSIVPKKITDIEGFLERYTNQTVRFVISKDLRWQIRDMLDETNMNERMIFPGLDGISTWLARHYYVRRDRQEEQK